MFDVKQRKHLDMLPFLCWSNLQFSHIFILAFTNYNTLLSPFITYWGSCERIFLFLMHTVDVVTKINMTIATEQATATYTDPTVLSKDSGSRIESFP